MNSLSDFLTALAAGLIAGPALWVLLKATGLLLLALGMSLLLHRAPAGSRHLVWLVALAGLLGLPLLAGWTPIRVPILPAPEAPVQSSPAALPAAAGVASHQSPAPVQSVTPSDRGTVAPSVPASESSRPLDPATVVLLIWGAVGIALLARLAVGAWAVRRIVRRSTPLDTPDWINPLCEVADRFGLPDTPRLCRSADVAMPFAAGLLRPTVVLPAESDDWSAERRVAVLIHELGHIRRRDLIGHTVGRIACAIYWFHPLVWSAARRLRAESERACDDLALAFGSRPAEYAEHLLDIVSCVRNHRTPAVALAMAHRKEFEGRMLAILDPTLRRQTAGAWQTAGIAVGLGAAALLLGAAAPVARQAEPTRQAPAVAVERDSAVDSASRRSADSLAAQPQSDRRVEAAARPVPPAEPKSSSRPVLQALLGDGPRSAADSGDRVAVLARTLRSDSNPEIRRIAAWGLADYADRGPATDALIDAVTADADPAVREMAAWSLAESNSEAAGNALVTALRQDRDSLVRQTAVWALGSIGNRSNVDPLLPSLAATDPAMRELAAWAIGACEPKSAPAALVGLLSDADPHVRLAAAWALYAIEDPSTGTALERAYGRERDPEVRAGLIRALGTMGDQSVDLLERLVNSSDTAVRRMAVTALAGGDASGPWPWPRPQPRPYPGVNQNRRMGVLRVEVPVPRVRTGRESDSAQP